MQRPRTLNLQVSPAAPSGALLPLFQIHIALFLKKLLECCLILGLKAKEAENFTVTAGDAQQAHLAQRRPLCCLDLLQGNLRWRRHVIEGVIAIPATTTLTETRRSVSALLHSSPFSPNKNRPSFCEAQEGSKWGRCSRNQTKQARQAYLSLGAQQYTAKLFTHGSGKALALIEAMRM